MIRIITRQLLWAVLLLPTHHGWAQRTMEQLDRGVVALPNGEGDVFVSWRLLANDPTGVGFNVYRVDDEGKTTKLNNEPLVGPTGYVDQSVPDNSGRVGYFVRPLHEQMEGAESKVFEVDLSQGTNYLQIDLEPLAGYTAEIGRASCRE